MKRILLLLCLSGVALAQTNSVGPQMEAYVLNGSAWNAATSTFSSYPIDAAPAVELYCLNTTTNKWVPCTSVGGGGGGVAPVTVENVFSAAGTINYAHNLSTPNPLMSCYAKSGSSSYTVAEVDTNNVAVTTAAASDLVCAFGYAPAPSPNFSFALNAAPSPYVPALSAVETVPLTLTQTAASGYVASTTYSVTGAPSGLAGSFSPNPITGGSGTSALSVSFPYNQPSGGNSFTVSGTGSGITHTQPVTLNIATTNNGLVEGWPANEGTGSTLHTVSSSGDNLTATNVTWGTTTGFPGQVAQYNGSAYAVGANQTNTNFSGSTPLSVCVWMNATTFSPTDQGILSTVDLGTSAATGWDFEVIYNKPSIYFVNNLATSNLFHVVTSTATLTANTTYMLCFTYDGSMNGNGISIYINGVSEPVVPVTNALTGPTTNTNPVILGARHNGAGIVWPFSGALGYPRIYNRALTSAEVSTLYAAGAK